MEDTAKEVYLAPMSCSHTAMPVPMNLLGSLWQVTRQTEDVVQLGDMTDIPQALDPVPRSASNQMWWWTTVIPALGRSRALKSALVLQFEANLDATGVSVLKNSSKKTDAQTLHV